MAVRVHEMGLRTGGIHAHYAGRPFVTRKTVLWVSSTHARASDTNPGTEAEEPKATLMGAGTGAIDASVSGGIIVCLDGHVEVTGVVVAKELEIIGVGTTSTKPSITPPYNDSATHSLSITSAGVIVRNFNVNEPAGNVEIAGTGYCVNIAAAGVVLGQLNVTDSRTTVALPASCRLLNLASGAGRVWLQECSFTWDGAGEATSASANGMVYGIYAAANVATLWIDQCSFTAATLGFDLGAVHVPNGTAITGFRLWRNTFGAGCDVWAEGTAGLRGFGSGNTWAEGGQRLAVDSLRGPWPHGLVDAADGAHAWITDDNFFMVGGGVLYVDSAHAHASDSNAGTRRTHPKATISGAVDATGGGELILVAATHVETRTGAITPDKDYVTIFGVGAGTARPTLTLNPADSNSRFFALNAHGLQLHNLRFLGADDANADKVSFGSKHSQIVESCDFVCGENDGLCITVPASAAFWMIDGCTFTVTADGPVRAISVAATSYAPAFILSCVFDGGTDDWSVGAVGTTAAATLGNCMLYLNTLRNDAKMKVQSDTTTQWNVSGTIADVGSPVIEVG